MSLDDPTVRSGDCTRTLPIEAASRTFPRPAASRRVPDVCIAEQMGFGVTYFGSGQFGM
jgi:hypothetical protein